MTVLNSSCWPLIFLQLLIMIKQPEWPNTLSHSYLPLWSLLSLSLLSLKCSQSGWGPQIRDCCFRCCCLTRLQDCSSMLINQMCLGLLSGTKSSRQGMSCVCSTELLSPQAGRMHAGCLLGLLSAQNCDGELVRGCCCTGQKSAGLVHTTTEHCITVSECSLPLLIC